MEILYGDGVFACLLQMYRWMNGWVDGRIDLNITSIFSTRHVGRPVGQSVTQKYLKKIGLKDYLAHNMCSTGPVLPFHRVSIVPRMFLAMTKC